MYAVYINEQERETDESTMTPPTPFQTGRALTSIVCAREF